MKMILLYLCIITFLSLHVDISAQEVKAVMTSTVLKYNDPLTVDPCNPKPTESSSIISFDGTLIDSVWWEYIRKARNLPKKFRSNFKDRSCQKIAQLKPDMRRYYWEIACPYTVHWLSKFTRKIPTNPFLTETCYILYPCREQIRIVNCTSKECLIRCHTPHPNVENSVCLESNFVEHKKVLAFCIHTHKKTKGKWEEVNCRMFPHFCLKKVTIRVPQTCECWSCWDMYRTDPSMISRYEAAERGKK